MTLRSRRGGSVPSVASSQSALQHVGGSNAHEKNRNLPAASRPSDNGTVIHCPRKAPEIETVNSSEQPQRGHTRIEQWLATTSIVASPDIIDVDELGSEEAKDGMCFLVCHCMSNIKK